MKPMMQLQRLLRKRDEKVRREVDKEPHIQKARAELRRAYVIIAELDEVEAVVRGRKKREPRSH